MIGYIILGVLILLVFACLGFFLFGYSKGQEKEHKMYEEIERNREQTAKEFNQLSGELKQGVRDEAEAKKASLSSGSTGRDRFNNINNSLQNNP